MRKSLSQVLTWLLKDAKTEHTVAVINQKATDDDWPEWYGEYISKRLTPILTEIQGICEVSGRASVPVAEAHVSTRTELEDAGPGWWAREASCHERGDC